MNIFQYITHTTIEIATKGGHNMESKKRKARDEKKTLNKAQEVHFFSEFKAADRAMERARGK